MSESEPSMLLPAEIPQPNDADPRPYDRLAIKDEDNPYSIINITPDWFAELVKAVPDSHFKMTHKNLHTQARPNKAEERLRLSFWNEYDRVIHRTKPSINLANVYGGVCTKAAFTELVTESKFKLAYILSPPPALNLVLDEVIYSAFAEMKKILNEPLVDEAGKFNVKLAEVKFKILHTAMLKRHGNTKNINIKSQNLHAVKSVDQFATPTVEDQPALVQSTAEDIEAALMEDEIRQATSERPEKL